MNDMQVAPVRKRSDRAEANEQRVRAVFADVLQVPPQEIDEDTAYQKVKAWDSVAHMAIIAGLDEAFDIMIDTDDVIDMNSYPKALQILRKYDVEL